ncbi:MAG: ABC transporter substrate-binding protein, partial [Nitrososphaerota archaeon]
FLKGGPTLTAAMTSGSVHVGFAVSPVFTGAITKPPLGFVLYASTIVGAPFTIYSLPEIKTPEDLKGKEGAVISLTGFVSQTLRAALRHYGIKTTDVKLTPQDYATALGLLSERKISFGIFPADWYSWVEKKGLNPLIDCLNIPDASKVLSSAMFALPKWVQENPEEAEALVKSLWQANLYIKTHPEEFAKIISKYTGVTDLESIILGWKTFRKVYVDTPLIDEETVRIAHSWFVEERPELKAVDPKSLFDNSLAQKVVAKWP